jgi:hypothetical protein
MAADQELVFSKKVLEMITVSNEFCLFLEEHDRYEAMQILAYMERLLPLLYLKASLLPSVEVSDQGANERFVTEEQWETMFQELKEQFGSADAFFFNTSAGDQELRKFSLAEQLSDIYQDLKDFLTLYQRNTMAARENAVSSCRELFQNRWGSAALRALFAIHHILYGNADAGLYPGFHNN